MLISIKIQKNFIYIFIFMFINLILDLILKNSNIQMSDEFIYFLCQICLIFFYIIEKYLSKNRKDIPEEDSQVLTKVIIILMICSLIFNSIYIYKYYEKYTIIQNEVEHYMIIIIFLILIEKISFKRNFYYHQKLSIMIIIIIFLYFLINNIIQSKFKLFHILFVFQYYSYSFKFHLIKYLNMKYFINIYLLGSIHGIFTLIQYLIQYFEILLPEFNLNNISSIILLFIIMMINVYLEYKIITELGLIYRFMSDFISIYISQIIILKNCEILLYGLLLIISCLIYLEIIQLNFCGLNKNIKQNIENRMEKEVKNDLNNKSNDSNNIENNYLYNELI